MEYQKFFENAEYDCILVSSEVNRFYLTRFKSSFGFLLLTKTDAVFFTDSRYVEDAEQIIDKEIKIISCGADAYDKIKDQLNAVNARVIGYENNRITVAELEKYNQMFVGYGFAPINDIIENQRRIKTDEELEIIEDAAAINDKVFKKMLDIFKIGVTEREAKAELEYLAAKYGADGMAFDTILAFGANSSKPHSLPGNKKLENGDVILMDYGVKYKGYSSDMTRTVCMGKNPQFKAIHEIVLAAQKYALARISDGVSGAEIDMLAREYIKANGYGDKFNHGLGHSVGVEIHENPRFSPLCNDRISTGMVMTVEPGIYLEGVGGIRIEDLIVVKDKGIKNLTNASKEFISL